MELGSGLGLGLGPGSGAGLGLGFALEDLGVRVDPRLGLTLSLTLGPALYLGVRVDPRLGFVDLAEEGEQLVLVEAG